MFISILVPCYNEEEMINKTHAKLTESLEALEDVSYEIIYINDGSRDRTLYLMREIAERDDRVRYISFSRNFGKEAGIIAGYSYASGEAVVLMDGDLQNPPSLLGQMIEAYRQGYDVVSAKRTREGESASRTFFARAFYKLANRLIDVELTDGISDFRLLSRKAVNAMLSLQEYNRFSKGLFSWIGFKTKVIEYENVQREAGETKWNFSKSMSYAIDGIFAFSNNLLRICIPLGLITIIIAIIYIIWVLLAAALDIPPMVDGYFTLISAILLLGGLILFSVGILGEYIGKIYYEVKRRPHYLIDETNIRRPKHYYREDWWIDDKTE